MKKDAQNSYKTTYKILEDKSIHFTTVRDIDAAPWNYVIPLDTPITMIGAFSESSHSLDHVDSTEFQF